MLAKATKNPYSDRQIIKISMNVIWNTNDIEKVHSDWYGKVPVKHTWED